ncbi:MAG: hypothetical protein N3B18_06920 [Desulfobacterota bacterium]|nr:hypothetical protein [Thermodesulfobacteriota bacterium]
MAKLAWCRAALLNIFQKRLLHFRQNYIRPYVIRSLAGCITLVLMVQIPQADAGMSAADIDFSLFVNDRIHLLNNFYTSGRQDFSYTRNLHVLYVNPAVRFSLSPRIRIVFETEGQFTFDFNRDEHDSDIDLRNAYIQTALPNASWLMLTFGQQSLRTMDGIVYDDESPTIRINADFERGFSLPVKLDALVTEIKDRSPYVNIDIKYCYSLLESVRLLYGWFRDYESGVARIFNALERQHLYTSRGNIRWIGLSATTFVGNMLVKTTGIFEHGSTRLKKEDGGVTSLNTRGYALDISAAYIIKPELSLTFFFYLASGDSNPHSGTLKSFLSIDPYIDKTNIYFNGGIDSRYSSDNVGLGGIQPAGIIAPGVSVDVKACESLYFKYILARLLTHRHTAGDGRDYGWETDMTGYYMIRSNIQLFAELNMLRPGSYFKRLTENRERVITEFLFGINFLFND